MALASLQTGFRDLIRAGPPSAPRSRQRTRILKAVKGLERVEGDALQRIPEARLSIYHDLVVGSHRALAAYIFGSTFAVIPVVARARPELMKAASQREIVEAFIAEDFARTHSLRELADRFGRFLAKRYAKAIRRIPLIAEMLRFERVKLDVDLMEDGPGVPATEASLQELASRTVGDLLQTRVLVPAHLRILRLKHDLGAAISAIARAPDQVALEEIVRPLEGVMILTRHPVSLVPISQIVPATTARDLSRFKPGIDFSLEQLAEARQARGPKGESEEDALNRVLSELFGWLGGGILYFAPERPAAKVKPSRARGAKRRPRSGR